MLSCALKSTSKDRHGVISSNHTMTQHDPFASNAANHGLFQVGCTCPRLSCGKDLWNEAADERSPLFSWSVPTDAANSVSAHSVRWVSALAALSAGYASDDMEMNAVRTKTQKPMVKIPTSATCTVSWRRNVA